SSSVTQCNADSATASRTEYADRSPATPMNTTASSSTDTIVAVNLGPRGSMPPAGDGAGVVCSGGDGTGGLQEVGQGLAQSCLPGRTGDPAPLSAVRVEDDRGRGGQQPELAGQLRVLGQVDLDLLHPRVSLRELAEQPTGGSAAAAQVRGELQKGGPVTGSRLELGCFAG